MIREKDYIRTNNFGMTLPELIFAVLMLSAFTGVFVVVSQFTAKFFQPQSVSVSNPSNKEEKDILNDHMKINNAFDSIEDFLSQPGIEKNYLLNLKCTSLPHLDWNIPGLDVKSIPSTYKVCIQPTQLVESSYLELNESQGKPGFYILYSKPNNGLTYNSTPIRRIFCRPKPFCSL